MLPTQVNYPEFVPDQLLTSEHLNQLFGYLEEQGRLTRTNLIGIGIVCGLEVKTNAAGTELTIGKGCGVTSEGYLVSVPAITYSSSKPYNAVQERIYDRFVDGSKTQRFDIYELKQAAVEEGTTALNSTFLEDKVVLILVEILEEGAKNCNPNSCDDKGVNVTVTFRPLLISKSDAETLGEGNTLPAAMLALPGLKMRRYDVTGTNLKDTAAVFKAFGIILNQGFLKRVEEVFSQAYTTFFPLLPDLYNSNPFAGLAGKFKFLYDGTIDNEQLLNLQYYYDLFSDLLLAYAELQKNGSELISSCCPDSNLFPRHLLLDLAIADNTTPKSSYRHDFIPSPIIQGNSLLVKKLRSLFKRLVLLSGKFFTPPPVVGGSVSEKRGGIDTNIRITPSKLGEIPLSEKAIPFYYNVADGPDRLVDYWDYNKTNKDHADQNLSYRANEYNGGDEDVLQPLLYDLEPYNFLRIEGHLGKPYAGALRNILKIKQQHRLPFEVIALSTDVASLQKQVRELNRLSSASGLAERFEGQEMPQCQFQDLESLYDTLGAELTCSLCKEMKYFYDLQGMGKLPEPASRVPQVTLLKKCAPDFLFTTNTLGHDFEVFYASIKNQAYVGAEVFLGALTNNFAAAATTDNQSKRTGLGLLYYIEKLSETIVEDLNKFDLREFNTRYSDLLKVASQIRTILRSQNRNEGDFALAEDVADHLDALIFACKQAQFQTLHKDYLSRWVYIMMMQKFGYFLQTHPGIQHKAGVTVGGTFILVYHEGEPDTDADSFLMTIEDVFSITGRGTVVSGRIERGEISNGDLIKISGMGAEELQTTVTGLETGGKMLVQGKAGDTIGLLLRGTKKTDVLRGMIVTKSSTVKINYDVITDIAAKKTITNKRLGYLENVLNSLQYKESGDGLNDLIDEISNGTIIADFYLPYLCYSDCPPVHYILPDEKEEPAEKINISIDPKEYCSADKTSFPVTVSPQGGEVTGEGVKIVNGSPQFLPTGVNLGGNLQKTVTITYTKDGQSVSADVVVFQTPKAGFTVIQDGNSNPITFSNQSESASSFEWNFGDDETSTEKEPSHTYKEEGTYTVVLTAINGTCQAKSKPVTVVIKEAAVSNCLPLAEIDKAYQALPQGLNPKVMAAFKDTFQRYQEVDDFFKELKEIASRPVTDHLKFFKERDIVGSLPVWLNEVFVLKSETFIIQPVFRLHSILTQLTLYIECIQKEDIGLAELDVTSILTLLNRQMKELSALAARAPEVYNEFVEKLLAIFKSEQERINSELKPKYFARIETLIKTLTGQ